MQQKGDQTASVTPSPSLQLTAPPAAPLHPSLPPRPTYDFAAGADSIGLGATPTVESVQHTPVAVQALAGSNRDVVANRRSIRMANMSAAEVLKAELAGTTPGTTNKLDLSLPSKPISSAIASSAAAPSASLDAARMSAPPAKSQTNDAGSDAGDGSGEEDAEDVPGLAAADLSVSGATPEPPPDVPDDAVIEDESHGVKRKFEEGPGAPGDGGPEDVVTIEEDDEEEAPAESRQLALKINPDGTVEQEDTVR